MIENFKKKTNTIDWYIVLLIVPIILAGLVTMSSFSGDTNFFNRQLLWVIISFFIFFIFSFVDFRFLRRTDVLVGLFAFVCLLLISLFFIGTTVNGARGWIKIGGFSVQPVETAKLVIVLILAKYFSRRHIEIANFKHIFISSIYALIPFLLVIAQPDFGSAIVIFLIWLGMTIVSGISKKHLITVGVVGVISCLVLWFFVFKPYQKARIVSFINPLSDIMGSGYNAYQSTVAVGSGQAFGKGVGYGTQSRLKFLPEHETDFIFAAFSEEWGFVGSFIIVLLYVILIWRILLNAMVGSTNFEILFGIGVCIYFMIHVVVNIGMNIGLFPVTGIPLPFMSYGGGHLLTEFMSLGILMGMRRYKRVAHKDDTKNEFLGM